MNNRFETTIRSLTDLMQMLNNARNYYFRIVNFNLDYSEYIEPMLKEKEQFLYKLMGEYKRLTKSEFTLDFNFSNYIVTYNNIGILNECLKIEDHLIELYQKVIDEDVMWEVLPVLALHVNHLKASKTLLLNFVTDYKRQNRTIKIDFSNHPTLVN